jgi:REP element-mobilizing transposase RayT
MRSPQINLFSQLNSKAERKSVTRRLVHGGDKSKGKRKTVRPLATKKWIHLVLKSDKATGRYSMLAKKNSKWIDQLLKTKAKKFGVELKEVVNMGNHIHFQLRISSRRSFQAFLRSITNLIARHVTGARKGKKFGRFWQGLAFTRVLTSAFEVTRLQNYFIGNRIERQHGKYYRDRYLTRTNSWMKSLKPAPI